MELFQGLSPNCPVLVNARCKVDSADAIPTLAKFLIGVDGAQTRSFTQIFRDTADGNRGVLKIERVAGRDCVARLSVIGCEQSNIRVADFAGHSNSVLRVHDGTCVDENDGRIEVAGILKEKWPQLRKVDGEALVDGELRLIGLDVAEIGVDGCVDHDAVFKDEFGFASCRALKVT